MTDEAKVKVPQGVEGLSPEDAFVSGVAAERERVQGQRLTREQVERMTPEEVNQRWDEVQRVLEGKDR